MKANFEIIIWDGKKTELMKAWDLFECGKEVWEAFNISITYKKDIWFKDVEKIIPVIVEAYEKQNQVVSFLHLQNISDEETILKNNNKVKPYIKKWVKTISNWRTWFLLSEYIKQRYWDLIIDNK